MRLHRLTFQNIGTFLEGEIDFIKEGDAPENPPVTIITGENGTGKTLILDAIRLFFGAQYRQEAGSIREIARTGMHASVRVTASHDGQTNHYISRSHDPYHQMIFGDEKDSFAKLYSLPNKLRVPDREVDSLFVLDYWTSMLSTDKFEVQNLIVPKLDDYLKNSLSGVHKNIEVTQLITYFDYLRGSDSPQEKALGEFLYSTLKEIVKLSLDNGELAYVKRTTLAPIIKQGNLEISLNKLSSGNLYFIQRMVSLLGKMYAVGVLENKPIEVICKTEGILLIDEAENHLHPKWQKRFIRNITTLFPKMQIILTTHSPFIVSSVKNARVYVCKSQGDHSTIEDATEAYNNMPVEDILLSEAFNETTSFNEDISDLMRKRKQAIKNKEHEERKRIEGLLLDANPNYFAYFETDALLEKLTRK